EAIWLILSPLFFQRFQLFHSRCITCPSDSLSASLSDELLSESLEESDGSGPPPPGARAPCLLWFPRGERDLDRRAPVFCGGGEGGLPPAASATLDSPLAGPIPSPAVPRCVRRDEVPSSSPEGRWYCSRTFCLICLRICRRFSGMSSSLLVSAIPKV